MTYNGQSMVSPEESSTTIGNLGWNGERLISMLAGTRAILRKAIRKR